MASGAAMSAAFVSLFDDDEQAVECLKCARLEPGGWCGFYVLEGAPFGGAGLAVGMAMGEGTG